MHPLVRKNSNQHYVNTPGPVEINYEIRHILLVASYLIVDHLSRIWNESNFSFF